jgi:transcriptional regulator with XRE-family HTH domain
MDAFSNRLRDERKRLNLSQEDFAALGGVKKGAQFNYENGSRSPDAAYLAAIAKAGVDVKFLLTGSPSSKHFSPDETELLAAFRRLDEKNKARLLGLAEGMAAGASSVDH